MHIQKRTTELSSDDCLNLNRASFNARVKLKRPLNTLVTLAPYPGSLPSPKARSIDLNRLRSHLDTRMRRHHGEPLVALWVWHSNVTGRNPHVHVFMHCPPRLREQLTVALKARYPEESVIDVSEGGDLARPHPCGYFGSTLGYLMRFMSQQAYRALGKKFRRESVVDANGVHRGVKAPLLGKRWGCTRNISPRALDAFWAETKARLEAKRRAA